MRRDDPLKSSLSNKPDGRAWPWIGPLGLGRLGLGALILATSLVLGLLASWWLVPAYLALMVWLVLAPADSPSENYVKEPTSDDPNSSAEPSGRDRETISAPWQPPGGGTELLNTDGVEAEPDTGGVATEVAEKPGKGGRRKGKSRARSAREKTVPEPPPASWVRVAPGKFVRVEGAETLPDDPTATTRLALGDQNASEVHAGEPTPEETLHEPLAPELTEPEVLGPAFEPVDVGMEDQAALILECDPIPQDQPDDPVVTPIAHEIIDSAGPIHEPFWMSGTAPIAPHTIEFGPLDPIHQDDPGQCAAPGVELETEPIPSSRYETVFEDDVASERAPHNDASLPPEVRTTSFESSRATDTLSADVWEAPAETDVRGRVDELTPAENLATAEEPIIPGEGVGPSEPTTLWDVNTVGPEGPTHPTQAQSPSHTPSENDGETDQSTCREHVLDDRPSEPESDRDEPTARVVDLGEGGDHDTGAGVVAGAEEDRDVGIACDAAPTPSRPPGDALDLVAGAEEDRDVGVACDAAPTPSRPPGECPVGSRDDPERRRPRSNPDPVVRPGRAGRGSGRIVRGRRVRRRNPSPARPLARSRRRRGRGGRSSRNIDPRAPPVQRP